MAIASFEKRKPSGSCSARARPGSRRVHALGSSAAASAHAAAAEVASEDPIIAGFAAVGAEAVPMPAIPAMGAVFQYWGIAEAEIINGADPVATWQKLASDVQAAIG